MKTTYILLLVSCAFIAVLTTSLAISTEKLIKAEEAKKAAMVELHQIKFKCKEKGK